jgi:hypothetical protein
MRCTSAERMPPVSTFAKFYVLLGILSFGIVANGCVKGQPASDTGDPGFPFGPSAIGVQPLGYIQDVKPILDRDCLSCHRSGEPAGGYSVSTYANVLDGQTIGNADSKLVVTSSPGGSMYPYFRGNAQTSATIVFRWLVYYNAAQAR